MVWSTLFEKYMEPGNTVSIGEFVIYGTIGPDYSVAIVELDDNGEEVAHRAVISPDGEVKEVPEP